jgi:hypothetical protein
MFLFISAEILCNIIDLIRTRREMGEKIVSQVHVGQ